MLQSALRVKRAMTALSIKLGNDGQSAMPSIEEKDWATAKNCLLIWEPFNQGMQAKFEEYWPLIKDLAIICQLLDPRFKTINLLNNNRKKEVQNIKYFFSEIFIHELSFKKAIKIIENIYESYKTNLSTSSSISQSSQSSQSSSIPAQNQQVQVELQILKKRRRFRFLKGCSHLLLVQLV